MILVFLSFSLSSLAFFYKLQKWSSTLTLLLENLLNWSPSSSGTFSISHVIRGDAVLSLLPFCKEAPLSSRFGSYCLHFPIPADSTRASTGFLWHFPHFLPVSAHCPLSKLPYILNFCNGSTHLFVPKSVLISYCSWEYTLNLSELNTNNHLLSFIWHSGFYGAGILKQLSLLVMAGSLLLCCSQDAIPDCGYSNLNMAKGSASQLVQ